MTECGSLSPKRAPRPRLEVADIFREHGEAYRQRHVMTAEQREVMAAISTCRTKVLGGHADVCEKCGHVEISYNSCRNRHCPKCQALPAARWIDKRQERIIPVHYFHLVFTLPRELRLIALNNRRPVFDLLFKATSETLLTLGADPKSLGGRLGITAVLHTWTRELHFHPHLHCIVTGGGLSGDGRWVATSQDFLFPVRVLSALFRGKFLHGLRRLRSQLDLACIGDSAQASANFDELVASLYRKDWVVYAKRPFDGPQSVFAYLARYTHRVAISNYRLIDFKDGQVTFATKNARKVTVSAETFIRRFLLHVLPKGFVKIRHYGLLSPCHATTTLEKARAILEHSTEQPEDSLQESLEDSTEEPKDFLEGSEPEPEVHNEPTIAELDSVELLQRLTGIDLTRCPRCGEPLVRMSIEAAKTYTQPEELDSS